ncbi:MAG: hypothetical protein KZQ99_07405 [Candidatus Thiodiazotropha sp. (ex Dulcina madagascariensis)]|nr:hypothetical protein [Candidatus Thiodiazotropha sp. (ex Dulcina madagascariensis)]
MASQYQHHQLFRRVPNALLARYFEAMSVDLDLDFGNLAETPIFEALESWLRPSLEDFQGVIVSDEHCTCDILSWQSATSRSRLMAASGAVSSLWPLTRQNLHASPLRATTITCRYSTS